MPQQRAEPGGGERRDSRRNRRTADEARRQSLLEAGVRAFSSAAFDEIPVSVLAEQAGVSEGLIFRYFGDKRTLYVEALKLSLQRGIEACYPPPGAPRSERLRLGLESLFEFAERSPNALAFIVRASLSRDPAIRKTVHAILDEHASATLAGAGIEYPDAKMLSKVRDWLLFLYASTGHWARGREAPREWVIESQIALYEAIGLAAGEDY